VLFRSVPVAEEAPVAEAPSPVVEEAPVAEEASSVSESLGDNVQQSEPLTCEEAPVVRSLIVDEPVTQEPLVEECVALENNASSKPSTDLYIEEKNKFVTGFNIKEDSYDLIHEFYEQNKDEPTMGLLNNELLRHCFANSIKERQELSAVTEDDVNRALRAIDTNNDDKINKEEFIQLILLFCSSKNNIKTRIDGILNYQSAVHEKSGLLTSREAHDFTQLLHDFYGKQGDNETANHTESFFSKIINKFIHSNKNKNDADKEDKNITYAEYSVEAGAQLDDFCFVKF